MRHVPHIDYPAWASYDGQFYAQRALDPLCRDPRVDRAMDLPPFRARRILFSWTAYVLGLGRPAWIINVYALQNVACWLLLAALLTRWLPPTTGRGLALWTACLFSHGAAVVRQVRASGRPKPALTAIAVRAVERGRPVLSAAIVGLSGLARETNLFALASQPRPVNTRTAARLALAVVLAVAPLLLWEDYLRSIYRSTIFAGADQFMTPGRAIGASWSAAWHSARSQGLWSGDGLVFALLSSIVVQAAYVLVRRDYDSAWWRVALPYVVLLLIMDTRTRQSPDRRDHPRASAADSRIQCAARQ